MDKFLAVFMGIIMAAIVGIVIFLSIPEKHVGVITSICYLGSIDKWEYSVNLDGGESITVTSSIDHEIGDDIGIGINYWTTWERN